MGRDGRFRHTDENTSFRTRWDTSDVRHRDRFSYFREGVCQAFFHYTPLRRDDGQLSATIETAVLANGVASQIETLPHSVVRTRADFANIPGNLFSLNLTRGGGLLGVAAGAAFRQEKHQLSLVSVNAIERFDLVEGEPYSVLALIFDKSRLRDVNPDPGYVVLNQNRARALASCVKMISDSFQRSSCLELDCLMDAAVSLLNALLVGDPDFFTEVAREGWTSKGIFFAVRDYILRHLDDPELTTTRVAAHFGLTARHVQKLFAEEKSTLKSFVVERRLERVASDIADPQIYVTVEDVAQRWGFRDMTNFHKSFRRRYDDTPKQMRLRTEQARKEML